MSCVTGANPTWGDLTVINANANSPLLVMTEDYFSLYPKLIMEQTGWDCDTTKAFILANLYPTIGNPPGIQVIKMGGVIPAITSDVVNLADVLAGGFCAIDSNPQGNWTKSVTDGFETTGNVGPFTAGGSFQNEWVCQIVTGGANLAVPMSNMLLDFDFDAWWCCATVDFNCCGGPPVGRKSGFLIPRPETPEIGDENISTPVFELPLYLSNYTAQFTNNFGRVKKI